MHTGLLNFLQHVGIRSQRPLPPIDHEQYQVFVLQTLGIAHGHTVRFLPKVFGVSCCTAVLGTMVVSSSSMRSSSSITISDTYTQGKKYSFKLYACIYVSVCIDKGKSCSACF